MTFLRLAFLVSFFLYCSAFGVGQEAKAPALSAVGMTTRAFVDGVRKNWQGTGPRPLNTVIWYPAAEGSSMKPFTATPENAQFFGGADAGKFFAEIPVAFDAPPLMTAQKHPLVLLSHGSTGLGLSLMWLGAYLASHGYIVAAVNHHGNTAAEGQFVPQGFSLVWERPEDITAVLTDMLGDSVFGGLIDPNRIGAAGHSAGGATVIQIAGGVFDYDALVGYCNSTQSQGDATCEPRDMIKQTIAQMEELKKKDAVVQESFRHEKEPHSDPRVKAVIAMAPAIGPAFTKKDLSGIHIPVLIVVGAADDVAPKDSNAGSYARLIKGAKLTVIPRAGHMVFSSACSQLGKEKLDGCRDPQGVDRTAVQSQLERQVLEFFEGVWAKE
jgi:predicted dienelactone hydrolase